MPVEVYALILLVIRLASIALMLDVIIKQWGLRRRPLDREALKALNFSEAAASGLRDDMNKLAWEALALNIIPVILDTLTLIGLGHRSTDEISTGSVLYTFSYSIGTLIVTRRIHRIYRRQINALTRAQEE